MCLTVLSQSRCEQIRLKSLNFIVWKIRLSSLSFPPTRLQNDSRDSFYCGNVPKRFVSKLSRTKTIKKSLNFTAWKICLAPLLPHQPDFKSTADGSTTPFPSVQRSFYAVRLIDFLRQWLYSSIRDTIGRSDANFTAEIDENSRIFWVKTKWAPTIIWPVNCTLGHNTRSTPLLLYAKWIS